MMEMVSVKTLIERGWTAAMISHLGYPDARGDRNRRLWKPDKISEVETSVEFLKTLRTVEVNRKQVEYRTACEESFKEFVCEITTDIHNGDSWSAVYQRYRDDIQIGWSMFVEFVHMHVPLQIPDHKQGNCYVYAIGSQNGPIKIGHTTERVSKRLGALQTSHPYKLIVHYVLIHQKASEVERFSHHLLAVSRLNGEWFEITKDVARETIVRAAAAVDAGEARCAIQCRNIVSDMTPDRPGWHLSYSEVRIRQQFDIFADGFAEGYAAGCRHGPHKIERQPTARYYNWLNRITRGMP